MRLGGFLSTQLSSMKYLFQMLFTAQDSTIQEKRRKQQKRKNYTQTYVRVGVWS